MREVASLAGLVLGALLFAVGVVASISWLILLGFIVMPAAFVLGLTGGPARETTVRGASPAEPAHGEPTPTDSQEPGRPALPERSDPERGEAP